MACATILLADNKPEYLDSMAEILETEGFEILRAETPTSARQLLESAIIHLALIDLRLSDDGDMYDESGLELARSVARPVPKLILTGHPTYQAAVAAMKPDDIHDLPPAVDFVYKGDGYAAILTAVHEALRKFVDNREEQTINLSRLRDLILEGFNISELRSLCMDLSLRYEELSGLNLTDKVIELIYYFQRRRLLLVLVNTCQQKRPSLPWQSVYKLS